MPQISKLQAAVRERLKTFLPYCEIQENIRPAWLECEDRRLELDLYIPIADIAIEIQGAQHYYFTPMYHKDVAAFEDQKRRDALKKEKCETVGVRLYEVASPVDLDDYIDEILKRIREKHGEYASLQWHAARWQYVYSRTHLTVKNLRETAAKFRKMRRMLDIGHRKIMEKDREICMEKIRRKEAQYKMTARLLYRRENHLMLEFEAIHGPEPRIRKRA